MKLLCVVAVLALAAPAIFCASVQAEERVLFSFEDPASLQRWQTNGQATLTARHVTQGKRALQLAFPQVKPDFGVKAGSGPYNLTGYQLLQADVFLAGPPMVVTLRMSDLKGKTYTCWYYLLQEGFQTIEYSIPAVAAQVDVSQVDRFWWTAESSLPAATYMVERQTAGEQLPLSSASAVLTIDNVRLHRGPTDDAWLLPRGPKPPAVQVPGNLIDNGSFEWGFWNWASWGTWDNGSYLFGTGRGDNARTGRYSAAIIPQRTGRGGIWTEQEIGLAPGTYTLTFSVKAGGPDVQMFYGLERGGSDAITQGKTCDRFAVPETWTTHTFDVTVKDPGGPVGLYLYNVGSNTLYIDDVSLVPTGGGKPSISKPVTGKPVKVTIKDRVTYVNGKPFFPLGFYQGDPAGYEGTGFNFTTGQPGVKLDEFLDTCAKLGVYTQVYLEGLLRAHVPDKAGEVARQYKNHPALLGWYICDEPDHMRWNVPPPEIRLASKLLHEEDPNHLTWIVVMPWADSNLYQYANTCDVLATDDYPIGTRSPLTHVAYSQDVMVQAHRGPTWMVPQATSRATPDEEYLVTYLALTHGASGIVYWEYNSARQNPTIWETMKKISLEIKELTPALTSPTSKKKAIVSNEHIHHILKETKDAYYLITVSDSKDALQAVALELPWLPDGTKAEVMFENRSVATAAGRLTDDFTTYQRHVYRIPKERKPR
jgi:predicted DNA-binding protein